jgi:hypothetical protein
MDSSRLARPARRLGYLNRPHPRSSMNGASFSPRVRIGDPPELPEELTARMRPTYLRESVFNE